MNDISPSTQVSVPSSAPVLLFQPLSSPTCEQLCTALAAAQGAFGTPKRTKPAKIEGVTEAGHKYSYTYMYAPLEEIIDAIKVPLAQNGLSFYQFLVGAGSELIMRTMIRHASGEWVASDYPIFQTRKGGQGFASGVTYARRYGLSLAFGLAPEDDDDGNIAEDTRRNDRPQTTAAPDRGKPAAGTKVKPLPTPPGKPVYDPETGEVHGTRPQPIQYDAANPIAWGGRLVAEVTGAKTRAEAEAWIATNLENLQRCEREAPKVYDRVDANIEATRAKFMADEIPADFMPAK